MEPIPGADVCDPHGMLHAIVLVELPFFWVACHQGVENIPLALVVAGV